MRPISGSAAGGATSDLAITAGGQTLDFYLSPKRNVAAAKRFLAKALRSNASAGYPRVINTDKVALPVLGYITEPGLAV
ncbi:transposase [Corynebacterium glutamicum ZL-6]|nr:transposase [Corynebacterium glutamicum]ANR63346.1 transposase [[Brevibacterium] flavum ZL-1]ANR66352.1 transposase [Corynebacterium glutamicum ZL-6]PST75008.1 transposase [Corynebacterium glutamicum ZL-2]ANU34429.1 transposase [Corynebacterium glutamicum]